MSERWEVRRHPWPQATGGEVTAPIPVGWFPINSDDGGIWVGRIIGRTWYGWLSDRLLVVAVFALMVALFANFGMNWVNASISREIIKSLVANEVACQINGSGLTSKPRQP